MTYDLDGKLISQINPNELQARGDAAKGFRYYYDSEEAKTYYHYVSDEQGSITHVLYKKYRDEGMSAEAAFYRMRKELGLPTSRIIY